MKEIDLTNQDQPMVVVLRSARLSSQEEIDAACSQTRAAVDAMNAQGVGVLVLPDCFQVEIKSPTYVGAAPATTKGPPSSEMDYKTAGAVADETKGCR
jgi:hypothetical protein